MLRFSILLSIVAAIAGGMTLFARSVSAATETVTVTATVGSLVSETPLGGGSIGRVPAPTGVRFSGFSYPFATVSILKNGQFQIVTQADKNGYFTETLDESYDAHALYTIYADDQTGERSIILNYPLAVYEGYLIHVSGIRFPPTIRLDKFEVRQGGYITVSGFALPRARLEINFLGLTNRTYTLEVGADGTYRITLPLTGFLRGEYVIKTSYADGDQRSSILKRFVVGFTDVSRDEASQNIPGDINLNGKVDLTDFSIFAFWYGKKSPPVMVDLNGDRVVDLADLSILAYYWTN